MSMEHRRQSEVSRMIDRNMRNLDKKIEKESSKPEKHHGFSKSQYLELFRHEEDSKIVENAKYRSTEDYLGSKALHEAERKEFALSDLFSKKKDLEEIQTKIIELTKDVARRGKKFSLGDIEARRGYVENLRLKLRKEAEYIISMKVKKRTYLSKPKIALEMRRNGEELISMYKTIMFGIDLCGRHLKMLAESHEMKLLELSMDKEILRIRSIGKEEGIS